MNNSSVSQAIESLHPRFVNLRIAAKEIESELNLEQHRGRPLDALLDRVREQIQAQEPQQPHQPMSPQG